MKLTSRVKIQNNAVSINLSKLIIDRNTAESKSAYHVFVDVRLSKRGWTKENIFDLRRKVFADDLLRSPENELRRNVIKF